MKKIISISVFLMMFFCVKSQNEKQLLLKYVSVLDSLTDIRNTLIELDEMSFKVNKDSITDVGIEERINLLLKRGESFLRRNLDAFRTREKLFQLVANKKMDQKLDSIIQVFINDKKKKRFKLNVELWCIDNVSSYSSSDFSINNDLGKIIAEAIAPFQDNEAWNDMFAVMIYQDFMMSKENTKLLLEEINEVEALLASCN